MSILPALHAKLDKKMSDADCQSTVERVKSIKGVLSVNFNEKTRDMRVSYIGSHVIPEVRAIKGLRIGNRPIR